MAVKASKVKESVRKVEIDVLGDILHITYAPGAYTPAFLDHLDKVQTDGLNAAYGTEALGSVIRSWDYLDDDGVPLPISEETMRTAVPLFLLNAISAAIREDMAVSKKSMPTSSGSFGAAVV